MVEGGIFRKNRIPALYRRPASLGKGRIKLRIGSDGVALLKRRVVGDESKAGFRFPFHIGALTGLKTGFDAVPRYERWRNVHSKAY